jgi:hypothetical protein
MEDGDKTEPVAKKVRREDLHVKVMCMTALENVQTPNEVRQLPHWLVRVAVPSLATTTPLSPTSKHTMLFSFKPPPESSNGHSRRNRKPFREAPIYDKYHHAVEFITMPNQPGEHTETVTCGTSAPRNEAQTMKQLHDQLCTTCGEGQRVLGYFTVGGDLASAFCLSEYNVTDKCLKYPPAPCCQVVPPMASFTAATTTTTFLLSPTPTHPPTPEPAAEHLEPPPTTNNTVPATVCANTKAPPVTAKKVVTLPVVDKAVALTPPPIPSPPQYSKGLSHVSLPPSSSLLPTSFTFPDPNPISMFDTFMTDPLSDTLFIEELLDNGRAYTPQPTPPKMTRDNRGKEWLDKGANWVQLLQFFRAFYNTAQTTMPACDCAWQCLPKEMNQPRFTQARLVCGNGHSLCYGCVLTGLVVHLRAMHNAQRIRLPKDEYFFECPCLNHACGAVFSTDQLFYFKNTAIGRILASVNEEKEKKLHAMLKKAQTWVEETIAEIDEVNTLYSVQATWEVEE